MEKTFRLKTLRKGGCWEKRHLGAAQTELCSQLDGGCKAGQSRGCCSLVGELEGSQRAETRVFASMRWASVNQKFSNFA